MRSTDARSRSIRALRIAARMIWTQGSVNVSTADASIRSRPFAVHVLPHRCRESLRPRRDRASPAASMARYSHRHSWRDLHLDSYECSGSINRARAACAARDVLRLRHRLAGIEDRVGHVRQRILTHHRAALEGHARHAVDQRRCLVLTERYGRRRGAFRAGLPRRPCPCRSGSRRPRSFRRRAPPSETARRPTADGRTPAAHHAGGTR